MINNKKIAFVTGSLGKGGSERVISILANEFANHGFDVTLINLCEDTIVQKISEHVKFVNLAQTIGPLSGLSLLNVRAKVLKLCLMQHQIDVVISFQDYVNIIACKACKKLSCKVIISERNDPAISKQAVKALRAIYYNRADYFVFQTDHAKSYFSKSIQKRSSVIFNPINTKEYTWNTNSSLYNIIMVGRLAKQKNQAMMIKAMPKLLKINSNFNLSIYGEGPIKETLEELISNLNLENNVKLYNYSDTIFEILSQSGIYVLTSFYEGMPNSLMESLAIGVPSIAVKCPIGGPEALINDYENGFLINYSEEELIDRIQLISENKDLQEKISLNAKHSAQSYAVDEVVKTWINLVNKLS